jgi:hypothetical protein
MVGIPTSFRHTGREDFFDRSLAWRQTLLERPSQHRFEFVTIIR